MDHLTVCVVYTTGTNAWQSQGPMTIYDSETHVADVRQGQAYYIVIMEEVAKPIKTTIVLACTGASGPDNAPHKLRYNFGVAKLTSTTSGLQALTGKACKVPPGHRVFNMVQSQALKGDTYAACVLRAR